MLTQSCRSFFRIACWSALITSSMYAEGTGGVASCRDESVHLRPASARILSLSPSAVPRGEKAVLSWYVPGGAEVLIQMYGGTNNGFLTVGQFPPHGSLDIWPQANTIYVITYGAPRSVCVNSIWVTVR